MPLDIEEFTRRYRAVTARNGRTVGDLPGAVMTRIQVGQERALQNYQQALDKARLSPGGARDEARLLRLINEARYLTGADEQLAV